MEKYRKWTDEATGVNPFIVADQKQHNLLYKIFTIAKSTVILILLLVIFPFILLGLLLPILSGLNVVLVALCGNVIDFDDNKFKNDLNKLQRRNSKIILSNFSSLADVFYFIFRVPGAQFIIIHEAPNGDQAYELTKGLGCFLRILTKQQPFFVYHSEQITLPFQTSLKKIISQQSAPTVLFYEAIRTNALGIIKISKTLSQKLHQIEKDYMICKISYSPRDQLYFNLVRSPLNGFFRSLGSFNRRSIKVRSQITDFSSIHNVNELKKQVDSFMSTNGSKLLETNPKDFDAFIDFYYKTQKSNYVHDAKA